MRDQDNVGIKSNKYIQKKHVNSDLNGIIPVYSDDEFKPRHYRNLGAQNYRDQTHIGLSQGFSDVTAITIPHVEIKHQQLTFDENFASIRSSADSIIVSIIDIIFSLLAIPILFLPLLIIGIAIRLNSPGPAILVQDRMGRDKKTFKCLKFRTMYTNADEILNVHLANDKDAADEWSSYRKLRNYDPRVTKIGQFLRKTSLDELPQIFNVLKGEMSLLGPRPYLPSEEKEMKGYCDVILLVLPGITGLWQVSGRNGLTFNDRLKLDAFYVLNRSLWLDAVIFFKTIKVVLKKDGAY
jgi:undecaprenyl-phosphate galactose phosphotransferase